MNAIALLFRIAGGLCIVAGCVTAVAACEVAADCNDGNPCTSDSCNAGVCVNTPVPNPGPGGSTICNAGVGNCMRSGYCVNGQCNAQPINCSDGNACTSDHCTLSGGCVHFSAVSPEAIGSLSFSADRMQFSWERPPSPCGPTNYDVASGTLAHFPVGSQPGLERCILASSTQVQDPLLPASGEGFWYDVRAQYFDPLGGHALHGPYGTQRLNAAVSSRQTTACP